MQTKNTFESVHHISLSRHQFIRTSDQSRVGQSLSDKMFEKRKITILADKTDKVFTYSLFSFNSSFIISGIDQPAHRTESIEPLNSVIIATTNYAVITDHSQNKPENYYPGESLIMSPGEYVDLTRSSGHSGLGVVIQNKKLVENLTEMHGITVQKPIKFERRLDMNKGTGRSLTNLLHFICSEADDEASALSLGVTKSLIEDLLVSTVIECLPHSYTDSLQYSQKQIRPLHVKRAVEYVMDNLQQRVCLTDLVEITGVTARSLQLGFNDTYGVGPMVFIRDVRLKRAREELLRADPNSASVADIAETWQFLHPSQFSKIYKKRFGELPSKTLNR